MMVVASVLYLVVCSQFFERVAFDYLVPTTTIKTPVRVFALSERQHDADRFRFGRVLFTFTTQTGNHPLVSVGGDQNRIFPCAIFKGLVHRILFIWIALLIFVQSF